MWQMEPIHYPAFFHLQFAPLLKLYLFHESPFRFVQDLTLPNPGQEWL